MSAVPDEKWLDLKNTLVDVGLDEHPHVIENDIPLTHKIMPNDAVVILVARCLGISTSGETRNPLPKSPRQLPSGSDSLSRSFRLKRRVFIVVQKTRDTMLQPDVIGAAWQQNLCLD